ncbi:thiamine phosphate synthase [uncultured Paenibacillus sp.]|uniref:thiamine phosphate synthase n=1 Tax=uncultured Paenibacillus sp. TaxID=227322 RepID=UPI0028D5CBB6|nr:thiamine phosphate synthase [uncultured Paenibacillus sp.]
MALERDFSLYVITGENNHPGRSMIEVMEAALAGGADILQLRDKTAAPGELLEKARALRELTRRYGVPFIVNDHLDIAIASDADGVHLGQEDMPIAEARRRLGPDRIIGISTHAVGQAREAELAGADYIGVGPVFPTGTKPGRQAVTTSYVRQVAAEIRIPWVAIGGITPDNAEEVLAAGATRLCAVSAIVGSPDPAGVCRTFKAKIQAAVGAQGADAGFGMVTSAGSGSESESGFGSGSGIGSDDGSDGSIAVRINGREERVRPGSLRQLIESYGLGDKRIVAELDGEIVQRGAWDRTPLRSGASLELIHFVGGG